MLNPASRITLPNLDDLLVYADDARVDAFYVIPAHPRIAAEEDGSAALQLVLYGRKEGTELHVTGGMLTLTTSLGLTATERSTVIGALTAQLAAKAAAAASAAQPASQPASRPASQPASQPASRSASQPASQPASQSASQPASHQASQPVSQPAPPPLPAELLPIDWAEAKVTVTLPGDLTLTGQPSMMAENRCSLSTSLTAAQATALSKAWKSSGDAGAITYTVKVRTPAASRTTVGASFSVASDLGEVVVSQTGTATSGGGGPLSLTLTGPLRASVPDLSARTSTITL